MNWYLRDANQWANDCSRYGARHRWQRRIALKNMQPWQLCPRCKRPLIPDKFKDHTGAYRVSRAWIARNIHLDHSDGSDTRYNGLVHAKCNLQAARHRKT